MKYPKGGGFKRGGKKGSNDSDPFFEQETKKRRKVSYDDEDIESIDSDAEENGFNGEDRKEADVAEEEDEFADETAGEKRKRLAEAYLLRTREAQRKQREERDDDEDDEDDEDYDGDIVKTLMKKQQEDSGRVRRAIASR